MPKSPCFDDYDIAIDTLNSMKQTLTYYTTFILEASTKPLQSKLIDLQKELYEAQHELFLLMYQNNWYPITKETDQKLQKTKETFEKHLNSFK